MRSFQEEVNEWMIECFGPEITSDAEERNWRFLEEALELVQANNCTKEQVLQIVEYVFNRSIGEFNQEVGGVMVTLAALCNSKSILISLEAKKEIARVLTKIPEIRAKQASKKLRNQEKEALP